MSILQKDRLPQDLLPLLESIGFAGSVAVQARQILDETRWLLRLAEEFPFIRGVVGWVDLRSDQLEEQLNEFRQNPKFVGVRHVLQDEPDDRFMLRKDFLQGIAKLKDVDLAYDILIFHRHLSATHEFVSRFPEHRFVVDHIAKPNIKDGIIEPWAQDIERLASFPNVFCKISGMVTEANWQGWHPADFDRYLDTVFEAFGSQRILIGSDWPVCTLAGSYGEVMKIVFDYVKKLSADEQNAVLGENSIKAYKLENKS